MGFTSNLEEERRLLAAILKKLGLAHRYYADLFDVTQTDLEKLRAMFTSATPEFYNDIPIKEALVRLYGERLTDCGKALDKPYFGKLLFLPKAGRGATGSGETQQKLYIGKKGINNYEAQEEIWVVDWRAPVSALYYSGSLGETVYQGPYGKQLADLQLKTTLDIQNGKLLGLYDSEVVATDDLLVKYLSKNKDVVLSEIVATIQKDQDAIIRRPLRQNILVQGAAGSGKTTVALHRISWLLYQYRETLAGEAVYILAANRLFLNYITSMLPDLDVPLVSQGTLKEAVSGRIRQAYPKLRFSLPEGEAEYTQVNFPQLLQDFLADLRARIFGGEVSTHGVIFWSKTEAVIQLAQMQPVSFWRTAELLDKRIANELGNSNRFALDLQDALFREGMRDPLEREATLKKQLAQLRRCYKSRAKALKPAELLNLFRLSLGLEEKKPKEYTLDDACLFALFADEIDDGCCMDAIKQVVVDEAQDLSDLHYLTLKSLFPNASFTIVGDVMQSIHSHGIQGWEALNSLLFEGKAALCSLLKSYRNTIEISDFAKRLVERATAQPFETQPLVRRGRPVQLLQSGDAQGKEQSLERILDEIRNKGYGLNAVICKDKSSADALHKALSGWAGLRRMDADNATLEKGSYIVSVADAKGLEFDCVVIWDFDSYDLHAGLDYKLLYVAATRALHELFVFTRHPQEWDVQLQTNS